MKLVSLLSGGIDSPAASYVMAKQGAEIILLHMNNGCYADAKELDKVKKIASRLSEVTGQEMPLYSFDHETNQTIIHKNCENSYQCVFCKRTMQHVAREFAKLHGCSGIVMGDSLGQVASQTLRNITAEGHNLNFPIVRPFIGMDKLEIIDIAQKIGTYDLSIIPTSGCGIVPVRPITEASIEKVTAMQSKFDFDKMIKDCVASAKRIQ
jgi:tRNA uracil 4-sulfurtransferase